MSRSGGFYVSVVSPRRSVERRGRLTDMVMISERPAEVEDRAVPGHWEGDLIVGPKTRSAVGTLVERSSRYVLLLHLPDGHTADKVRIAMTKAIGHLPAELTRSITWDQGSEMAQHRTFAVDTGIQVYFCDPHSPWQRGSGSPWDPRRLVLLDSNLERWTVLTVVDLLKLCRWNVTEGRAAPTTPSSFPPNGVSGDPRANHSG